MLWFIIFFILAFLGLVMFDIAQKEEQKVYKLERELKELKKQAATNEFENFINTKHK